MAQPITWRNVDAPSFGEASRMMALAQNGINRGFENFNNILKNEQAIVEANWKQGKENNTNAYLGELLSAKTPEELAARQDFLNQMRAGFGAQVDAPAVLKATDERGSVLQNRALSNITYQNSLEDQATAADQAAFKVATANGDTAAQKDILARNAGKRWVGDAAMSAEKAFRDQVKFGQDNVTFGNGLIDHEQKMKLFPGQLEAQTASLDNTRAQTALLTAQADAAKAEPALKAAKAQEKQTEEQLKIFHSDNAYGNKNFSTDPAKNVGIIADSVKGILGKTGADAAQKIIKFVAENPYTTVEDSSGNKVQLPLNSSVVARAIHLVDSGKKDSKIPFMSSEGYGDDYVSAVKNKIQELMSTGAKEGSSDSMLNSYATLQQLTANRLRGDVANAPAQTASTPAPTTASGKAEQAAPAPVTAALERAAAEAKKPESSGQPSVDPQTILAQVAAKDPKVKTFWVNGERYKYQSVTDSDNQVTGNAWVRDGNTNGIFSSGISQARTKYGYTGEDIGVDIKTSAATTAAFKESLKNSGGVTNAPADQPKVSAPMAGNVGQAKVPVVASHGVAYTDAGVPTPVDTPAPSKAAIKSLSSTPEVVSTYAGSIPKGEATKVRVTVGDGDTFKFQPSDPNQKVPNAVGNVCRFDVIDAPEVAHPAYGKRGQPSGEEAAAYLRNLMDNKEVSIKVFGQDKRKDDGPARNICQVEIEGKAIDLEMVKAGFAHVFDGYINKNNPRYKDLKQAESFAQTNKLGMFKNGYTQPGWAFRAEERKLGR